MANTDDMLSIGQAARYLGVSVDTLRRWDRSDRLKAVRLTQTSPRRYRRADLEALLDEASA